MADKNKGRGFADDESDQLGAQEGLQASPVAEPQRAGTRPAGGRAAGAQAGVGTDAARGKQQGNEALVRAIYQAFNDRAFDRVDDLVTDDLELVNVPFGQTFRGREGQREFMQNWATGFPDGRAEVTRVIDGGDVVAVEFTGRGTQSGPLRAPGSQIAPTNKRVEIKFCDVHEIKGGKIARSRSYFDAASMLRQLGLIS